MLERERRLEFEKRRERREEKRRERELKRNAGAAAWEPTQREGWRGEAREERERYSHHLVRTKRNKKTKDERVFLSLSSSLGKLIFAGDDRNKKSNAE